MLQTDTVQREEVSMWDDIWSRGALLDRIVAFFRIKYIRFFANILKKKVNRLSDIVELGCGTSLTVLALHRFVKSITAVDISEEALKISRRNAERQGVKNIRFIQDDCKRLGIPSQTFDLVWSQGLLEHFVRPEMVLEEHIRICKDEGCVVVCVPAKASFYYAWYIICKTLGLKKIWPWTRQDFYTKRDILRMFKKLKYDTSAESEYIG